MASPGSCNWQLWGRPARQLPAHISIACPWRASPAGSHTCSKPADQRDPLVAKGPHACTLKSQAPGKPFPQQLGSPERFRVCEASPPAPVLLHLPVLMGHLDVPKPSLHLSLGFYRQILLAGPKILKVLKPTRFKLELGAQVPGCPRKQFVHSKKRLRQQEISQNPH